MPSRRRLVESSPHSILLASRVPANVSECAAGGPPRIPSRVPQVGTYDYAGCLSLPRALWLDHDSTCEGVVPRLVQQPLPEIALLRAPGRSWVWTGPRAEGSPVMQHLDEAPPESSDAAATSLLRLGDGESFPMPASSAFLDIEITFLPGEGLRQEAAVDGGPAAALQHGPDTGVRMAGLDESAVAAHYPHGPPLQRPLASGVVLKSWQAEQGDAYVMYT